VSDRIDFGYEVLAAMPSGSVRLYNTMTQRVEPLEPIEPGHVKVYVCGPTPYDHAHAGNGRTFIVFDTLVRFLRARGYRVTYVRNVTDVDDKILQRAADRGEPPLELSRRMAAINAEELRGCGCLAPDHEPRVSESIDSIVSLVAALVEKDAAYVAPTGKGNDVYFAVRAFPGYGKLSRRVVDDLRSGARVEPGEGKRDPLDFALWKAAVPEMLGWESPWGRGRPGWHIECSAMAQSLLTAHFDIHGGGTDLIFPHHENEIAQSEAAWGEPFARVWLHSAFLNVDAEKMSKSLGNFVTIAQILERNDGEALRYFVLSSHYRSQANFDVEKRADGRVVLPALDEAERRVEYLYATREALLAAAAGAEPDAAGGGPQQSAIREAPERVLSALDNDLNTSVALSVIGELARVGNEIAQQVPKWSKDPKKQADARRMSAAAAAALDACCLPLGLLQAPSQFFDRARSRRLRLRGLDPTWIETKVARRAEARAAKDFAAADAVRKELAAMDIELQDVPGSGVTSWRVLV
jgi:cysteinyl-tRNA synthetase